MNIAIIGLGRVGSEFLEILLPRNKDGISIVAVAELGDTAGKAKAKALGLPLKSMEEITAMKDGVDIIFDLTGSSTVRKALREAMAAAGNTHTVIAPESFAYLLWTLTTNKPMPDVHKNKGY